MPKRSNRVTQGRDYQRIVRQGRRVGGQFIVTHAVLRSHDAPLRFGYITSKKVGNAVTRNLLRRRLKGISDVVIRRGVTGADVVFRVQPQAATASYAELEHEATRHLSKLLPIVPADEKG